MLHAPWFRRAAVGAGSLLGIILVLAAALPLLDLSRWARPLEVALGDALGRQVIISGKTRLFLLPSPALVIDGVFVANSEGGVSRYFILADRVRAGLGVRTLPQPIITVDDLRIDGLGINFERSADGGASWKVHALEKPLRLGSMLNLLVQPRAIVATNFRLTHPGANAAPEPFVVGRAMLLRPAEGSDHIRILAQNGAGLWTLDAKVATLGALFDGERTEVAATLDGPETRAMLRGGRAKRGAGLVLSGDGNTRDVGSLMRLFGLPGGQAAIAGEFTLNLRSENSGGTIEMAFPRLGEGDLVANLTYQLAPGFELAGKFAAHRFDLRTIVPPLPAKRERLFSRAPIGAAFWRGAQLNLEFAAEEVSWGPTNLGTGRAALWADHGILSLGPVELSGPSGSIGGDATLDVRGVPQLALVLRASVESFGAALKSVGAPAIDGRLDAALELSGTGASLADIMANAAGQTNLLFGKGTLAPTLAKAIPSEIAFGRSAPPADTIEAGDPIAARTQENALAIACLVSRFDIAGGRATSRSFLLETAEAVTTGEGSIDLGAENLDLRLRPRPRDPALIGQARDLTVRGPIGAPQWVAAEGETRRGLARTASALATAEGFTSFMPLLDPRAGLANPCIKTLMGEGLIRSASAASAPTR
ncbi:MAG: AsmA-like C-terminal region-containing protein [Alphaproteobacteria bacterium]